MMTQPLPTLSYSLTPADALAYELLPRELTGWRKWLLLVWLAAAGGLLACRPSGSALTGAGGSGWRRSFSLASPTGWQRRR